jgi:1-deoxy-D-xylulose-5-phosphate synthase
MAPRDEIELEQMLRYSSKASGPVVIRYPRGAGTGITGHERRQIVCGRSELLRDGNDLAIIPLGSMVQPTLEAAEMLEKEGICSRVINPRFIRPFDRVALAEIIRRRMPIVTVEEHALAGGFGSMILEMAAEIGLAAPFLRIGIPDDFVQQGSQSELRSMLKLDTQGIFSQIHNWLGCRQSLRVAI